MLDASSGLRHEYYPGVRVSYPLPQARVAHGPPRSVSGTGGSRSGLRVDFLGMQICRR